MVAAQFKIAKTDEDQRLVFGWASVAADRGGKQLVDQQGDMVDVDELEHAAYDHVLHFRSAGERHDEALRNKGRLVESVVFTKQKLSAMGIGPGVVPYGWWVGYRIDDDAAWGKIKSGEYAMFSIEGKAVRESVAKTFGQMVRKFNPNHDDVGRFSSGGSSGASAGGGLLGGFGGADYALTKEGFAQFKSKAAAHRLDDPARRARVPVGCARRRRCGTQGTARPALPDGRHRALAAILRKGKICWVSRLFTS